MAKQNETPNDRLLKLEEKDLRRDAHYTNLNAKIDNLTDSQKQIVMLLGGTPLNGNKGFISLLDEVDKRLKMIEDKSKDHHRDLEQVKFWGRGTAGVVFVSLGLVLKKLFNL